MSLKELVKQEYDSYKQRMKEETGGTYVLLYFALMFSILYSSTYGFFYEEGDYVVLLFGIIFTEMLYDGVTVYLSSVKENGKRVNIFEKYIYTPVNFDALRKAKMIVALRMICVPVILSQLASILVRFIVINRGGGDLYDPSVWIPSITGFSFLINKYWDYKRLCKNI